MGPFLGKGLHNPRAVWEKCRPWPAQPSMERGCSITSDIQSQIQPQHSLGQPGLQGQHLPTGANSPALSEESAPENRSCRPLPIGHAHTDAHTDEVPKHVRLCQPPRHTLRKQDVYPRAHAQLHTHCEVCTQMSVPRGSHTYKAAAGQQSWERGEHRLPSQGGRIPPGSAS